MAPPPRFQTIILVFSLLFLSTALADTPSDNDIPTLAMRIMGPNVSPSDITLELLCELSWLNFDAVDFAGWPRDLSFNNLMSLCDSAGVYYSICPSEVMQYVGEWADPEFRYWFRNSTESLTSDSCFARSNAEFDSIEQYTTAESLYYDDPDISIEAIIVTDLAVSTKNHPFLWFYEVYDEAPAQQWRNAVEDTLPWNDFIPNVYTQDKLSGDTLSLEEVEASGIFSIQKHYAENNEENEVTFTLNFSLLHTIDQDDYTGLGGDIVYGTMTDQARSVRAMTEAEYQPPPSGDTIHLREDNHPEFIMFDYYPFRQVHPDSALAGSGAAEMCDDDWLFLIDHFEDGIDSTVIPAWEDSVPVFYFPQTFGAAGGPAMWVSTGDTLDYHSYLYRNPSPQEFLMLCNLALLHQAKGIFPYNLCSYIEHPWILEAPGNVIMSSLLDRYNIPFDAEYEEWVYTGRWPDSTFEYIRPDSLPPWIDGYDPLYEVEDPPSEAEYAKYKEDYFEWLFEPYADLYNNIGSILADVKWIGPEMHDLWWCSDTLSDGADISYDGITPGDLVTPVIKVFEDESQDACYLFYVDRYCISNNNPYEITFNPADLPNHADCTTRLLDHSRRFIMDGTYSPRETLYTFLDTLDAGESRLLQLVDITAALAADVRITSSDIRIIQAADSLRLETTVGNSVDIYAYFYNMGTVSKSDVIVTLYDSTASELIGTDTLDFDGLGYFLPSACRSTDRSTASFNWTPDSTDIGVHRLTAAAATWHGEPDSNDNSVDFVFLVNPRDYATEVLGDSWDMAEGGSNDWHTADIEAVAENWNTSTGWTDSVSGMFEGMIEFDSEGYPFRGDISLAIPADSTEYIDADKYHMLSFGIVGYNPDYYTNPNSCVMYIRWKDDEGWQPDWCNLLSTSNYHVGNGWDEWCNIGPIDLNDINGLDWGDDDITELWLRFQSGNPDGLEDPDDIRVRIGWLRLEESAS